MIPVNNVGTQYTYPMCVGEVPEYELWNIIHTNIGAVTLMTKVFIQGMIERKCGAIVNMSSGSELQPLPLMTVYAASKVRTPRTFLTHSCVRSPKNVFAKDLTFQGLVSLGLLHILLQSQTRYTSYSGNVTTPS